MLLLKRKPKEDSTITKLIVKNKKNTNVSEQFRTIRTNIQYSVGEKKIKSVVITSARKGAGKSFAAANLAVTLAAENKRILLVDADFRKPSIHKIFRVQNTVGLTSLLNDENLSVKNNIQYNGLNNLYILPSGAIPPNPSELLNSDRMSSVLEELEQSFDFIIFDMPPVLSVTDAQIIAGKVDGTIFIIPKGEATEEDIFKSKELLTIVNAKILGVIINKVEKKRKDYKYIPLAR